MAFISTKSMPMLFLLPLAVALVSLFFSHNVPAQPRVERELLPLFGFDLTPAIADGLKTGAAMVGEKMSDKVGEEAMLKLFAPDAKGGFKIGVKVHDVMDKMKKKAKEMCGVFCPYGGDCKPCNTNSQDPPLESCEPYCVMDWIKDTCILCGPAKEDNSGSGTGNGGGNPIGSSGGGGGSISSTSPGSINTFSYKLAMLGLVVLLALK